MVAAQGASTTLKLRFAVGSLIGCFSHPARPALGYAAVQVVSFLVWGCVLQRPLPCLDKTSSGLEMYLSIGNRQHFRWNSKDQRGLGMRRFASTRSGSATRSVLYYKNIYLCAIRFFRRYATFDLPITHKTVSPRIYGIRQQDTLSLALVLSSDSHEERSEQWPLSGHHPHD